MNHLTQKHEALRPQKAEATAAQAVQSVVYRLDRKVYDGIAAKFPIGRTDNPTIAAMIAGEQRVLDELRKIVL